jgi:hypothetical protein
MAAAMLIVIVGTVQLIYSVINFDKITPFRLWKKSYLFYDKAYVPFLSNISTSVPATSPIVISSQYNNQPKYFIKQPLIIPPDNVTSKFSLFNYMVNNNLSYLLVYENFSKQEKLKPLFNTTGLKSLETDFEEIANYTTKNKLKLHLYQINKTWVA